MRGRGLAASSDVTRSGEGMKKSFTAIAHALLSRIA
jgi:hypothetical protein